MMEKRLFLWGLSNGATMFALAGAFWLGLGIGMIADQVHWLVPAVGTIVQVAGCVALIWAAARLRRRSGFSRSELRHPDPSVKTKWRRVQTLFLWTVVGQAVVIALAVWICVTVNARPMIWPSIGLAVSLHLVPLARLFHVGVYYVTALAGSGVSIVGFMMSNFPYGVVSLGAGLAIVMWLSAWWLLVHADQIAGQAQRER